MEIPGKSMHIYLQTNAVPSTISIARLVPLRMQRAATQVTSDLVKKQVITNVNKPTPWCAPGFFVPKPSGTSVRLVTDYTKLNNLSNAQFIHSHQLLKSCNLFLRMPNSLLSLTLFMAIFNSPWTRSQVI